MLFSLMKNVHSKHDYFVEYLEKERNQSNIIKEQLFQLKEKSRNNIGKHSLTCHRCWFSIYQLDYDHISSYIVKNNRPIKRSYDDTISSYNYLLSKYEFNGDNFSNTISIVFCFNFLSSNKSLCTSRIFYW